MLPKKELLVEFEPNKFIVYYPEKNTATKICFGKESPVQLVQEKIITIEEGCKLITTHKHINAKNGMISATADQNDKFIYPLPEYKKFKPTKSTADRLKELEYYSGNKIHTTNGLLIGIVVIGIVLIVMIGFCCSKKSFRNKFPKTPNSTGQTTIINMENGKLEAPNAPKEEIMLKNQNNSGAYKFSA